MQLSYFFVFQVVVGHKYAPGNKDSPRDFGGEFAFYKFEKKVLIINLTAKKRNNVARFF